MPTHSVSPISPPTLASLTEGQHAAGFVAHALYVDDLGHARGARLVHERTRFVFDYLAIETAPQAYVYATTYPSSDSGAPHTQEHLLLGKGNKGRWLGNVQHVSLATTSAATFQYRTAYHFNTSAGVGAFWGLLHAEIDALLHPDYSDEEIRREVRNFDVARRADGTLAVDEKGTVYNEMVTSYDGPDTLGWYALARLVYGDGHPLACSQGGSPEGIRALSPEEIRRFHGAHYQLANMGMVGAFPSSVPLGDVLAKVGETLDALAPKERDTQRYLTEAELPPPRGAPPGTLRVVDYPYATADHPGSAILAWPATRRLSIAERTAVEMFLAAFAGGESSTMYDALVDRTKRALDLGATSVGASSSDDPGQAVFLSVENVAAAHAEEASLRALRDLVLAKLREIAALPDGSPELAAFGERMKARVIDIRRRLDKALDTPPRFGERWTGDFWIRHLTDMGREGGFRKLLALPDAYEHALTLAASRTNPWRDRISAWGLLDVPYGVVLRASPAMRKRLDEERDARNAAEVARIEAAYGAGDAQEALRKREGEIARETEAIAKAEASVPMPSFVSDPPMTFDDSLAYRQESLDDVPLVASTFEAMKSSTVGLAFRVEGVREEDLLYLSVLPSLMSDVGVVRDRVPIPYDAMSDRLRREILDLDVRLDASFTTGRVELAVTGSGDSVAETQRATDWMQTVLSAFPLSAVPFSGGPDWRPENLPRIRDVVLREATRLRDVMTGREEWWAQSASEAYRRQDSVLLLHAASFLTKAHDAFRVSWMLEGADEGFAAFMRSLSGAKLDREGFAALAQALSKVDAKAGGKVEARVAHWVAGAHSLSDASKRRAARAGRELGSLLVNLPDSSLASDWSSLCETIAKDSLQDPKHTLTALGRVLLTIVRKENARAWMIGSTRSQEALVHDLNGTLAALFQFAPKRPSVSYPSGTPVTDRARARGASVFDARVAALVNPSTSSATIVASAPTAGFDETGDARLTDFLAANVFGGTGAHSFYKRIWGAGLAYAGHVVIAPRSARMTLYSDRCADLSQLLRFVDGEVRKAPTDPRFVDYAVANTFHGRTADAFESRAAAIATDLAEGVTPGRVRAFRARLLALRARPGLADAIHARLASVYGATIPSLAARDAPVPDGAQWFAIGPDAQLRRYEEALAAARRDVVSVLRLHPRDFWL
jgi:Zn-dependent M16 (insulinase) family peptidase